MMRYISTMMREVARESTVNMSDTVIVLKTHDTIRYSSEVAVIDTDPVESWFTV